MHAWMIFRACAGLRFLRACLRTDVHKILFGSSLLSNELKFQRELIEYFPPIFHEGQLGL